MIRERAYPVEPWHVRETRLDLDLLAQSESVFALANGHIGLRGNLDEGEPHGLPGTYLNSFYELRPLPYAEAGYGFPESGQTIVNVTNGKLIRLLVDDEPFDVRYGELRSPRAGARPAGRHPGPGASSGCRRPARRSGSAPPGWCRSPSARSPRSCYEVEPVDEPPRLILQSELVANEQLPPTEQGPAGRRGAGPPAAGRGDAGAAHRRPAGAPHQGQRPADGRGDGPPGRGAGQARRHHRGPPGLAAHHRRLRARAGRRSCGWSSWSRTAGPAAARCPALRDQVGAALASARLAGWDGPGRGAARVPRRVLGRLRRAASTATRRCSRRSASALFHVLQAGARAEQRPIARQGPDRPRVRRPHVLGHRDVRAAGADLHPAGRGGATCCAGGTRTLDLARERAQTLGPAGRRVPVAHHPRAGVLGVLAGRHGRRSTSAPTSPTRSGATCRPPATTTSSARSAWSCWSRPPGCGARSATTTGTAGSTSTASPARTSTPRWSTTTSTPT